MEERRSEQEHETERRDKDRDWMIHHPPSEAGPRAVRIVPRHDASDGQRVDPRPDDGEQGREKGQRRRRREEHDDGARDSDRTQDHELEEDEARQPEQHRQAREEDCPSSRFDRRLDGAGHPLRRRIASPGSHLLSESARHQERIVDPEAEPQERREIQHEDAHRGGAADEEDRRQGDDDGGPADHERQGRSGDGPEHEQERQRRKRERDDLASTEIGFRNGLDVAVERRAAGELHVDAGRMGEPVANSRQGCRRVVRSDRQEDDVVGRVAVRGDLPRTQRVRHDPHDVWRLGDMLDRGRGRAFEWRRSRELRIAVIDDHDG